MPILARQSYSRLNVLRLHFFSVHFPCDFGKTIVLTTQRSQIAFFSRTFSVVFNCRSLFNETAVLRRLRSPFAIRDADTKQSKTKIYEQKSPFVADFGCIGIYGPHLMIVMILLWPAKITFYWKRSKNFRSSPWILPNLVKRNAAESTSDYLQWLRQRHCHVCMPSLQKCV